MATNSDAIIETTDADNARALAAAASADWLSLIDPVHETILGTNGNDTLAAAADGDIVEGLRGDDDLSSTFNRTALIGDRGNDTLTTNDIVTAPDEETAHGLAIQLGGADNDTLNATVTLQGGLSPTLHAQELTADVLSDGGSGDDIVNATANVVGPTTGDVILRTDVLGGRGDDTINAISDASGSGGDNHVTNHIHGGSGDDHITALAQTNLSGFTSTAVNDIDGGDGNDVIDATASGISIDTELVRNSLHGGRGDDIVRAHNTTNSNGLTPVGVNELWGDQGNDILEATQDSAFRNGISDVTNFLDGGVGDDSLTAISNAQGQHVRALNQLEGGAGKDVLNARMDALAIGGAAPFDLYHLSNILNGGFGDDSLEAYLSVTVSPGSPVDNSTAENHLDGGNGNDTLVATVASGSAGTSFLNGGSGDDRLTVVGGTDNHLDGGTGKDTLISGTGDDTFFGGRGADAFTFAPPNGHDTISDFDSGRDLIDLTAFASADIHDFSDLTIDTTNGDSVIRFDTDNDVTVVGVAHLKAADFLFA